MLGLGKLDAILLAVFLVLFGVMQVTNIDVVYARPIMGFSALVAGVVILFRSLNRAA